MSNVTVQEALKAAIDALTSANYSKGTVALNQCKSALSDIEKCEPAGWKIWWDNRIWLFTDDREDYDNAIKSGVPVLELYTSPISKECEPVFTNTNHGFVMKDRNFTYAGNGYIQDNNFDHDAALKISGDFAEGDLDKYAQMIVKQLNTEKG